MDNNNRFKLHYKPVFDKERQMLNKQIVQNRKITRDELSRRLYGKAVCYEFDETLLKELKEIYEAWGLELPEEYKL